MRTNFVLTMIVSGLLAVSIPASAAAIMGPEGSGDSSEASIMCAPPSGSGLIRYVTTVTSATCNEALRIAVLVIVFACDVVGC